MHLYKQIAQLGGGEALLSALSDATDSLPSFEESSEGLGLPEFDLNAGNLVGVAGHPSKCGGVGGQLELDDKSIIDEWNLYDYLQQSTEFLNCAVIDMSIGLYQILFLYF